MARSSVHAKKRGVFKAKIIRNNPARKATCWGQPSPWVADHQDTLNNRDDSHSPTLARPTRPTPTPQDSAPGSPPHPQPKDVRAARSTPPPKGVQQDSDSQTWKMSEILPKQDCSFPDFTWKCVNYINFKIATKQRNLSANTMFTTFTSWHHVYLIRAWYCKDFVQ